MALPVLDGNQSATTLSSVVTGGEHIVAHTVVSLGSTAIANITNAVSGSVVSISNFPSTQTIAGTVTVANFPTSNVVSAYGIGSDGTWRAIEMKPGSNRLLAEATISGTVPISISSVTIGNSITIGSLPAIGGTVTVGNFPATQTVAGTVTANVFGYSDNETSYQPIPVVPWDEGVSGGRAVVVKVEQNGVGAIPVRLFAEKEGESPTGQDTLLQCNSSGALIVDIRAGGQSAIGYDGDAFLQVKQVQGSSVTIGSLPAISGTVTVGNTVTIAGTVTANPTGTQTIAGTVTANVGNVSLTSDGFGSTALRVSFGGDSNNTRIQNYSSGDFLFITPQNAAKVDGSAVTQPIRGTVTIGSLPAISGTVTAAAPNGSLTTRFGSVTTANTAQITSAVTNNSRKYLLIQNVTTSSNVITVGIGFTPTTTQGIQLTAGAGITFESSYIPTGAVMILSSVTASPFTVIEA